MHWIRFESYSENYSENYPERPSAPDRFWAGVLLVLLVASLTSFPAKAQSSSGDAHTHRTHEAPGERPTLYPDRVVLTWAEDPASSLSVTWRTDSTVTDAKAQIALARSAPSFFTQARTVPATTTPLPDKVPAQNVRANYHSVTFTGLKSDTLYAYRVGDGEHWSEWYQARTASDEPEPFSFIYFGDAQNEIRSHWPRVVRAAYAKAPGASFLIHAGDLVHNGNRNVEWGHWNEAGGWVQGMIPNMPVPGNHEYRPYERWKARDTLAVAASFSGGTMEGTYVEADGHHEPLVATREAAAEDAATATGSPAGAWTYNVDEGEYEGMLHFEKEEGKLSGRLVNDAGKTFPLRVRTAGDDTLAAEFMKEVEKASPRRLSIHWRPQFALPENGPKGMKETVYTFEHQGLRVIGLNSNLRDSTELRRQTKWLENTLAASDARWTVVTMHHPMFSSSEGRSNERLRKTWTPLFDEYQVDLVLQGHDHTYARGRVKNLQQGVNTRSPVGGTVYVNSVSGAKMYEIREDRWEQYESIEMERAAENTQLFQIVRVGQDTLRYRSHTATGEPYDAFNLIKQAGNQPTKMVELPPARTEERTHENTLEYARPQN
jgi:hypothetical protein